MFHKHYITGRPQAKNSEYTVKKNVVTPFLFLCLLCGTFVTGSDASVDGSGDVGRVDTSKSTVRLPDQETAQPNIRAGDNYGEESELSGVTKDTLAYPMHEDSFYEHSNLNASFVPREIVVKFKSSSITASLNQLNSRFKVDEIRETFADVYLLKMSGDVDIVSMIREYEANPRVEYAEPNYIHNTCVAPNDPYYSLQWAHQIVESEMAWDVERGDPGVVIAVVDTGVDWDHPDLAANIWNNTDEVLDGTDTDGNGYIDDIRGYDFVDTTEPVWPGEDSTERDNDPMDFAGHGTHCSGIAAAVANNSMGIAGVCWNCKIMAVRAGYKGAYGGGYLENDDAALAIAYAADNGANIISMSWGQYEQSKLIREATKYAYDRGVLLVAAAGNDATSIRHFPAAYEEVVAVSATDENDNPTGFTNFGEWIEVAAPGLNVYSTLFDDSYIYMSGTSMSAPHIAGVAALIWSRFPWMTRDHVRAQLRYTADDLGDSGFDVYYGYGRVNARRAVEQAPPDHDLLVLDWERPQYVKPGDMALINTTVLNFGISDESSIRVRLLVNNISVDSAFISFLASGASVTASCSWRPTVEGAYGVASYIVPVPYETVTENNVVEGFVYVGYRMKAAVLDSAGTDLYEVISTWDILNTNCPMFGSKMIQVDYTTLNIDDITYDDIAATEADALIISCAYSWEFTDSEIDAIRRYVHEGHGLIATAGTFYSEVPNNNKLAPLFGLDEAASWDSTQTDLLDILHPAHPLFLEVSDPYTFPPVGTAVPSDREWDSNELFGGTYLALGHYKESTIVAYRGLVYISPWLEIIPPHYHFHLQLLYNAITWSCYQRPEHELVVSLEAPARLKPGESSFLNATVSNGGLNNEIDVETQLLINSELMDFVVIPKLTVDSSYTLSYRWTPTAKAVYNVTAYTPPVPGEEFKLNNVDTKMVNVIEIVVENVLVYTDDADVYPSSRYPIVALDNLGIDYAHYADDPHGFVTALTSQAWDLVIVDHCNWYALGQYWTELEAYVHRGGFLILDTFDIDGSHSEPTTLWDTLGVQWVSDMPDPEPVYRWIPAHPIFTFPNTVGDLTSYVQGYYDGGDHVAATTGTPIAGFTSSPTEGNAAIVVGNAYRTLLMSFRLCEFRYDQDADGKLDAVELWENAVASVSVPSEHDLTVTLDAPTFLKPGDSSLLNATVHNRGLSNETAVDLLLFVNDTAVNSTTIPELLTGESWTINYLWTTPRVEATYNVTGYAQPVPGENLTVNNRHTEFTRVTYAPIIGIIETHGETLQSEELDEYYRSLGHIVEKITTTITLEALGNYDIIIVGEDWGDTPWLPSEVAAVQAFVSSGKGFVAIGDELATSVQEILVTYGISYAWISALGGSSSHFDPLHPIMQGVSLIHAGHPVNSLQITAPAYWIANDASDMYILIAGAEVEGYVLCLSNDFALDLYDADNEIMFKNIVDWMAVKYEHELVVSSGAPALLRLGDSSLLNATVYNRGLNTEMNVELQLLINGTLLKSITILDLASSTSCTIDCLWTPTMEATYNITAYVPPVEKEEITPNNVLTKFVTVRRIKGCVLWDQTHGTDEIASYDNWVANLTSRGYLVDTLTSDYISPSVLAEYHILVIPQASRRYYFDELAAIQDFVSSGRGLLVIGDDEPDIYTDLTSFAGIWWASGGKSGITTDIAPHEVTREIYSVYLDSPDAKLEVTGVAQDLVRDYEGGVMLAVSEHVGRVLCFADEDSLQNHDITSEDNLRLANNMIDWLLGYEHEVIVLLEAPSLVIPGTPSLLKATVYNRGLYTEKNTELCLLIDDVEVSRATVPWLGVASSYTLTYLWTPTTEGTYNVTAYTPPLADEVIAVDNVATTSVNVRFAPTIRVNPSILYVDIGESFTINIVVTNIPEPGLYGYQFRLYYNNTALNCTKAEIPEGHFLTPELDPDNIFIVECNAYHNEGYVSVAVTLLRDEPGKNGSGVLAKITFNGTDLGASTLNLIDVVLADPSITEIPPDQYAIVNGVVFVCVGPKVPGDLNRDGVVNILDLATAAVAYGSHPGHLRWNPVADLDENNIINILDITIIAKNFGKTT